jgi:hypothetical protein
MHWTDKYPKLDSNLHEINCSICKSRRLVRFCHGGPFGFNSRELLNGDMELDGRLICADCIKVEDELLNSIDDFVDSKWNIVSLDDGTMRIKRRAEILAIQNSETEAQEISEHFTCELDLWEEEDEK